MRILRIIYDFPPPWSGLAPFPYELTKTQAEMGHKITVICGRWPKAKPKLPKLSKNIKLIRLFREPFPDTMLITIAPVAFLVILKNIIFSRYDLIMGHGQLPIYYHFFRFLTKGILQPKYYFFLQITAKGRKIKAFEQNEQINILERFDWFLHELSDRVGVKVANHIFVTGLNTKKEAIKYYGVKSSQITVLENGVDVSVFKPLGAKIRKELNYTNDDFVILYVGAHNARKGVRNLVQALTKLPNNFKLLTLGGGDTEYLQDLDEQINSLRLQSRILLVGPKPYPLPEYFRSANLFVIPSSFEGFPKVVLESLACGTPVIASGFEVDNPPKGLLIINNTDPSSLALTIKQAASQKRNVNREEIVKRYAWEAVARKIDQIVKPNS